MTFRFAAALAALLVLALGSSSRAKEFYPIASVASDTVNFFAVENLIQGPGVGFDAAEPHDRIASSLTWVTDAPGGFPSDYIAVAGTPTLTVDLGEDRELTSIGSWGYDAGNTNGASLFSLRFATSAEGTAGFGTSITYNPSFSLLLDPVPMQLSEFDVPVTARYVEYTILDNHFIAPGDGSGGTMAGGDRTGLGEIAFPVPVPEPSSIVLVSIAVCGSLVAMRRRASN
jgi:hypothetical protein